MTFKIVNLYDFKGGIAGVFDVEELVEFLREQKAMDIVAIHVSYVMIFFFNHSILGFFIF